MGPPRAALVLAQLHRHLVQGTPAFRRGRRRRLPVGWRRWGWRAVCGAGGREDLLHGLLEQGRQVGGGTRGRWLRLGGLRRGAFRHPLRGAFFAGFDNVLQGGQGGRHALLQFGVVNSAQRVNLSERVTPSARLQNRACDFRRTRLLNVFCLVMPHGTRDVLVTVSVEQLEVGLPVVLVVAIHMVHL